MNVDLETQLRSYRRNFDREAPEVDAPWTAVQPDSVLEMRPTPHHPHRPRRGLTVAIATGLVVLALIGGIGLISRPIVSEQDPAGNPANGWIAFTVAEDEGANPDNDIWLVRFKEEPRRVIGSESDTVDELCPAFSPDGRRLAFPRVDGQSAALAIADVATDGNVSAPVIIEVGEGLQPPCPVWSTDGRQIAFGVNLTSPVNPERSAAGSEVRIVTLEGGQVTVLPDLLATDLEWSPDGSHLAVASGVDEVVSGETLRDGRLHLYTPSSGAMRSLADTLGATDLTWSPDSRRLAYQTGDSDNELWVIDIETEQQDLLATYEAMHGIGPVWSPDGESIVYQMRCFRSSGICGGSGEGHEAVVVTVGDDLGSVGSEVVISASRTATGTGVTLYPYRVTWSPDSQYLLYMAWDYSGTTPWVGLAAVPIDQDQPTVLLTDLPGMVAYEGYAEGSTFVPIQTWAPLVANEPLPTSSSVPASASPFLGSWVSTDSRYGESHSTMVIEASEDGSVEIIAHNLATPCVPAPTTMIGTGRLQAENELVIPAPVFTCDDGSQPDPEFLELSLTEFSEQFHNLTFTRDTSTDILTDNFGGVWIREGAEERGPESTTPHSETEITGLLNGFLEARIAGDRAQQYLNAPAEDIPLLYATTSGARYERGEFEQMNGVEWSYGDRGFRVRLFAGDTVVEQIFTIGPAGRLGLGYPGSYGTGGDLAPTTEDGQPLVEAHDFFDGAVILHFAHPWVKAAGDRLLLIPAGAGPTTDGGQRHSWVEVVPVVDPTLGLGCQAHPDSADAAVLAESIRSWPGLETTAPVAVGGGGAEGLMMDIVVRDPATACQNFGGPNYLASGHRMRLYLFDAPEGSSMRILAIPLVVPESDFERAVEATAPIAVEFHGP